MQGTGSVCQIVNRFTSPLVCLCKHVWLCTRVCTCPSVCVSVPAEMSSLHVLAALLGEGVYCLIVLNRFTFGLASFTSQRSYAMRKKIVCFGFGTFKYSFRWFDLLLMCSFETFTVSLSFC